MKLGRRARLAAYHVAVGHTLRSPSLRRAWANVTRQGRAGAAVRAWRADHPERFRPPAPPPAGNIAEVPAPVGLGGGGFEEPSEDRRIVGGLGPAGEEDRETGRPSVVNDLYEWIEWEYWDDPEAYDDEEIHGTTQYED